MILNRCEIRKDDSFRLTEMQRLAVVLAGGGKHSVMFVQDMYGDNCVLPMLAMGVSIASANEVWFGQELKAAVLDINDNPDREFIPSDVDIVVGNHIGMMDLKQLSDLDLEMGRTRIGDSSHQFLLHTNCEWFSPNPSVELQNVYSCIKELVDIVYDYNKDESAETKEYSFCELCRSACDIERLSRETRSLNKWGMCNTSKVKMTERGGEFFEMYTSFHTSTHKRKLELVARSLAFLDGCLLVHRKHVETANKLVD